MNLRYPALLAVAVIACALRAENLSPVRLETLTCEHLINPIGIGATQPRLSWKLRSDRAGEVQTAYEIRAATSAAGLAAPAPDLWVSGKIASDQSVLVPWGGKPVGSRAQIFWQVRVWDKDGTPTAWSYTASFELGLLAPATEWKGQWITADLPRPDIMQSTLAKAAWINAGSASNQAAAARFVLELPAGAKILGATLDAAADGLVTLYVNGQPTRQGPSSHTAPFHAEFGQQLVAGKNVVAIGANAVRLSRGGGRNALAAHGTVELDGGRRIAFDTDGAWKAAVAPTGDWFAATFDDSAWPAATVLGPYDIKALNENVAGSIGPGRYLRKNFTVKGTVAKARLYSTALGTYEASINSRRVNDHQLDPGWTDYATRTMVQTTDVTALLQSGTNTLGALLGDGWFAGRVGWMGLYQYKAIGTVPLFSAQLELTYADGTTDRIATDASWKGGPGEVVGSDQQLGEVWDARRAVAWDRPSFDDSAWTAVTVAPTPATTLVPQLGGPVREILVLTPKKITRLGSVWIVDLGQNMVGHVRLSARGPAGTTIILQHGEMLNADGTVYTENLRPAISLDTFTLRGASEKETFDPRFTFHGFRYVQIAGYPGELSERDVAGIVVGSAALQTGTFESSSADLNKLFLNIVWGQRGNFLSVPTDCPQRDERMGWMGDAQVFAPTATRIANVAPFFAKWLVDVNDAQSADGAFQKVAPLANQVQSYPVWGDAGVIIPWTMFTSYGDKKFLEVSYPHMVRWLDYCQSHPASMTQGVGDHLAPVRTPTGIVDHAYFAHSADLVAKTAAILGKTDDAAKFAKLRDDLVAAFNRDYVGEDGSITTVDTGFGRGPARGAAPATPLGAPAAPAARTGNTQAAYVIALAFDLLPEKLRPVVGQRLAADIEKNGHLTTGFVASGLLCPVLTQIGRPDLAWRLVFTDTYPSWLFSIRNGATTIWERWDGWTPEKGFQASSMNSFNHYSFGAIGYWFYTGAAGIVPDDAHPGYKHFTLAPQFTSRLTNLETTLETPYGMIVSEWHAAGDQIVYNITIPPNTSADVVIPLPGNGTTTPDNVATTLARAAGTYSFTFSRQLVR